MTKDEFAGSNTQSICIAYEQGYGYGRDLRSRNNPYPKETELYWAWDYGFSEGHRPAMALKLRSMDYT